LRHGFDIGLRYRLDWGLGFVGVTVAAMNTPDFAQRLIHPRKLAAPNRWDLVAFPLIFGVFTLLAVAAKGTFAPLEAMQATPISLDPWGLPGYALRTVLRMLAALAASLLFTLTYGTLAAKSKRAELILLPILDILQSVPILGYISFTVVFFMNLFPGSTLGAEFASIFAVFTSQAWNMAFSFYQSLRTIPHDLDEASRAFRFSSWQRFWRLEAPFAVPGLVWNMMMSMSGGWFFVVASEAISIGDSQITLPGIGSYVALAIEQKNLGAIGWALGAMTVVILLYDQLMFRPLVVWADHFRFEQSAAQTTPHSWFLTVLQRARLLRRAAWPLTFAMRRLLRAPALNHGAPGSIVAETAPREKFFDRLWTIAVLGMALAAAALVVRYVAASLGWADVATVFRLGFYTLLRVAVMIVLSSLVWVPLGVMIGLRPRLAEKIQPLAQFLAAFPANLLFPFAVILIVRFDLNPNIWLSLLMIIGTQWYILFNVIAGASAYPTDFLEAANNFQIHGWSWWRKVILPGIFPYFVTGALTASGGAWNASIVAESVSWGQTHLTAQGLGAYIANETVAADYPRIVLGIAVMSLYVIFFNRVLWRRLYAYGERRLRLD
jgi:NitT/TauT family transport system permease protein